MAMLRVHLMQNWFGYSDPAMEEALYETTILRQFAGLNLERIPDETTILNFRRLLEKHELAGGILAVINGYLGDRGLSLRQGTIVDATLINAPSSTKNKDGKRDPENASDQERQTVLCVTNTGQMTCDAVAKMEVGLPKSACRSGLQTTRCCCIQKVWW